MRGPRRRLLPDGDRERPRSPRGFSFHGEVRHWGGWGHDTAFYKSPSKCLQLPHHTPPSPLWLPQLVLCNPGQGTVIGSPP